MWAIMVLGLVQGLTEFLPVSSSGHLILFKSLFGIHAPGASLEVSLHVGTLFAVIWAYRGWLHQWLRGIILGRAQARRLAGQMLLASIPAGFLGWVLGHAIEGYFTIEAAALGWAATAVLLWIIRPAQDGGAALETLSWWQVWWVGCAQALALWPGLSRSGSTIAMARVVGIAPRAAAQFSFILAIPTVTGATLFEIPQLARDNIALIQMGLGALIAAAAGVLAIQWITSIVNRPHAWRWFSVYLGTIAMAAWIFGG